MVEGHEVRYGRWRSRSPDLGSCRRGTEYLYSQNCLANPCYSSVIGKEGQTFLPDSCLRNAFRV
jgi:hypothetical protein